MWCGLFNATMNINRNIIVGPEISHWRDFREAICVLVINLQCVFNFLLFALATCPCESSCINKKCNFVILNH